MDNLESFIASGGRSQPPLRATVGSDAEAIDRVRRASSEGRLATVTVDKKADPLEQFIASGGKSAASAPKPVEASRGADTMDPSYASFEPKGVLETAGNLASSLGTTIVGGWRGMAEIARGGSLDDAVRAVHGTDPNALARSYEPETEGGKAGVEIMGSPYNPLNWVGVAGDKAGDLTARGASALGASPEVAGAAGAAVNTTINAAPLALPKLLGAKVQSGADVVPAGKPRIKLKAQESPTFAEPPVPADGGTLPKAEQARRVEVLKRVGLDSARESAITGDAKSAATYFQGSKLDDAVGRHKAEVLKGEKQALETHAEQIAQDTGGTVGLDESARVARGNTIHAPLDNLKQWFESKTKQLYKAADERAKGEPADMTRTHEYIGGDQAEFLGTTEGESLLRGIKARMKSLGMADAEGNPQRVTVAQAEKLKQYLNNQWQPRTAKLIRGLRDAIDDDVLSNAGEDIYAQARAMRAMRAATLDEPKGIGKLLDASGPEGINRAVPIEKIGDSIAGMPVEQMEHVVKTLKNVPKELQPQAQAALAEIRAHFANKVLEAGSKHQGQWAAREVSKYLKANSEKMKLVMTPEELTKLADLNEAGHILRYDASYPGAAVQGYNLVQRGALAAVRHSATAIGSVVGGPAGAVAGERVGAYLAGKAGQAQSLRSAQKLVVPLSGFPK